MPNCKLLCPQHGHLHNSRHVQSMTSRAFTACAFASDTVRLLPPRANEQSCSAAHLAALSPDLRAPGHVVDRQQHRAKLPRRSFILLSFSEPLQAFHAARIKL